jgi:transcriptional regulator with XRE-family HTH domain
MNPKTEQRDYMASVLRSRRKSLGLTQREMAQKLSERTGITVDYAATVVRSYESGIIHATSSLIGERFNGNAHLARFGAYLQELTFDDGEMLKVIDCARNIDRRFVYPSDEAKLSKTPQDKLR